MKPIVGYRIRYVDTLERESPWFLVDMEKAQSYLLDPNFECRPAVELLKSGKVRNEPVS